MHGGTHTCQVVVSDGSFRPSVTKVKAGLDSNGAVALASGTVEVLNASVVTTTVTPTAGIRKPNGVCCVLQASTVFEVWTVAEVCMRRWRAWWCAAVAPVLTSPA